ncbi:MAG: hypothetical protein SWK76_15020 [Actinomycetota bacterium]|nr:hypothetical protein [Actinomycetota bacterium]
MKDKIYVPGPAKSMYAIYLSALAVSIYLGLNNLHPFLSGWRYPWGTSITQNINLVATWIVVIVAVVYLYYSTLGKPKRWNEPLVWYRILLSLLSVWYFLLTYALYHPNGWLRGMVDWLGGIAALFNYYEAFLWVVLLANLIYIYVRWVKSERFPRFRAVDKREEVS